jgi:hypothetical protein
MPKKIGLVETIDRLVDTQMELNPGMAVFGMVLDTLSGRTPLYRLTEFFEEKDTEFAAWCPYRTRTVLRLQPGAVDG